MGKIKPSTPFCWECGRKLRNVKGGTAFVRILGYDGNKHCVHKICVLGQFVINGNGR